MFRLLLLLFEHIELDRLRTSRLRLAGGRGDQEGSQLIEEGCAEGCTPTELEGEMFDED